MKLRHTASIVALAAGLAMAAAAAQAQSYSKVVVFGDSLSDNGNLGPAAPPPPYSAGRFSNGPVWVQQLGYGGLNHFGTATGSTDYAFGGARTDNNPNPSNPPATTPGMPFQVSSYLGGGGTLDATSLVTLWGGANDIFQQIPLAAANPATATTVMANTGTTAALNIGALVNQLANAGAGTILVPNLPTLSATPQFNSGPGAAAAPLADAGSNAFNSTLIGVLTAQAAAHKTTNIIEFDANRFAQVIRDYPALFGFTNVTQSCFNGVTVCATPGTYSFWDGVHPTTAAHHIIAQIAMEDIYYGNLAVPTASEGEAAVNHRSDDMDAALGQLPSTFEAGAVTVGLSIDGGQSTTKARNGGLMPEVKDNAGSVRLALVDPVSDQWRWGGQASATHSKVRAGAISFSSNSYSVDAWGGWRSGMLFLNGVGGVGFDDYTDINRVTLVAPLINTGRTSGYSGGIKLQGGLNWPMGGINLSPRVAVSHVHNRVDGYSEQGLLVEEQYANRDISATSGEATLRLEMPGDARVGGYVEAGYRDYFTWNGGPVTASLVGNTALPLSTKVDKPERGMGLVDAGIRAAVGERLSVGLSYRGRFSSQFHANDASVTLKWRF